MEFREEELVEREIEIAGYLREGFSIREIMVKTGLNKKIMTAHMRNMMEKLQCVSREDLIALIRRGDHPKTAKN